MKLAERYAKEITQGLQYLPTWLPMRSLSLGDVGAIRNNLFEPETTLGNLKIPFSQGESRPTGTLRYNSHEGVSATFKASGTTPISGSILSINDAGVTVTFSRAEAIVFEANGCKVEAISNIADLGQRLVWKYQEGSWDSDLYVITEIVMADAATVLISTGDSAVIELRAGGSVSTTGISLADINAQFSVASSSGIGIEMVAQTGVTPLFKAMRVRPGLFGTKWEVRRLESHDEKEVDDAKTMAFFSPMSVEDLWP
jgi:hypothetical protein